MKTQRIFQLSLAAAIVVTGALCWNFDHHVAAKASNSRMSAARESDAGERATRVDGFAPMGGAMVPESGDPAAKAADFGAWVTEKPRQPDFAKIEAFEGWVERWKLATPEERQALAAEGADLAAARRAEFKALIITDPKQALARAVPRVVRQELPPEIVSLLEKNVSATGDYDVYKGRPAPGEPMPDQPLTLRYFEAQGVSYQAYVYGEMEAVMSRKQIPLRGVAIDRPLAVAESPLRQLEDGEKVPAGTVVEESCPVSGETTEAVASEEPVTVETPTVEVGERMIALCNGSHVAVLDEKYRIFVQAAGPGSAGFFMDGYPGTASRAIGNFRCLYIRATYPDQMAPPNTEDQAAEDMKNTARFFLESSYGKMTTTTTVTPLIVMPQTLKWYQDKDAEVNGLGVMHSQAREAARQLGYDSTQYDCIILRVNGGLRSGASWGGGDSVWLGWGGMDVINHECGHSLGLGHANYWTTTDGTAYGDGSNQEYGNPFDVMGGGGGYAAHYNTTAKRNLGWLPNSYVHFPTGNGVFRVFAFDQSQLEEGKRYGLNVAKDNNIQYNIEYHANNGTLANQATVLYGSRLIDTTPGSPGGKNDSGIQIGRTFSDLEGDMHFTVVSKNATSPPSLDVAYFRGPFPDNAAPTATLSASATTVAVGSTVTFTVAAEDANGDALAYHWEFDDGSSAENSAVVSKTFTTPAQVTAMVTVSDMKGGTTRRHLVIHVGSHGKQLVAGNVSAGGQPLANVRVSITNGKFAYTDADGNYALAGVSAGSQTLTATLNGYAFTPSFSNPLTVGSGTNTANWTAAGSTFVILTKTADATEGGANGSFTLTRTGSTAADLTVSLSAPTGTATLTTDYTFSPNFVTDGGYRKFTIPAGQSSLVINVTAINDTAQEGPETIGLQVASNGSYLQTTANSAVMTIFDNDTILPQVAVRAPNPYAMEPAESGGFVFTRTGATTSALNLQVAWSGTAGNGVDYETLPSTVTIPAGQSSVAVSVTPIDDSLIEVPETIIATVSANAAYVRNSAATTATVTLSDDDTPVVTVTAPDAIASEDGPDSAVFLIHRSGSTAADLKVYYGLSGSAAHGTDYARLNGEVTIPAGSSSAPVVITPYDDDLGEVTETVTLAVTSFNNSYSIGTDFQATISITDHGDLPVVSVRAGATGVEGGANGSVIFRVLGSVGGTISVNYTVSGTATPGSDYTALSGTVMLPGSGPSEVAVPIPVINDAVAEPTETVKVTITPGSTYRIYNDISAEVAIQDNDSGQRVMVTAYNSSPAEGSTATGKFYLSRPTTSGNLTVNYALSGTATAGVDYTGLTGTAVIPDTASGVVVEFTPVDDSLGEGTETVTLTVVAGSGYGVDRPASATLEIADNDALPVSVGFASASSATSELPNENGAYRDIEVVLSAASTSAVTVHCVGGIGSNAMGDDVDWAFVDPSNGNAMIPTAALTFAPGITSQIVRIRVKNDGVIEGGETAVLELRAPFGASLTSGRNKHSLMIFDDVIPALVTEERWSSTSVYTNQTWSGSAPAYSGYLAGFSTAQGVADQYSRRLTGQIVAPATGSYTFWVAGDDAARLYLSTTNSAANKVLIASNSNWVDFQAWDANASQKSAAIQLVEGQSYYLEVQQREDSGGDHVSAAWEGPGFSRKAIVMETQDNAPRTVRFAVSSTSRLESDGSDPLLMVMLDRPAGSTPVTVDYTVGGTATPGSDYLLAPGTLTIAAGEQMKLLPLTLIADAVGESPEAIVVSLNHPVGAALGAPSTHTIIVSDADAPTIGTTQFTATSSMAANTVVGTAVATVAPGRSVAGWEIVAGNEGNLFDITASGQIRLLLPSQLPSPGTRQLVVRATDSSGATGDGWVNLLCNPPATLGVVENRWSGSTAYNNQNWNGTPNYSGTLATFTTPQNVADSYSRRLTGYLQPQVSGNYTFWIASDDESRLFLSSDATAANKVQRAAVSGWVDFQSWDAQTSQKSAVIALEAGKVYWLEVQHLEGGGGDHASVAWSGPGFDRMAIPASALYPNFETTPPVVPMIALNNPASGAEFPSGSPINIAATVIAGSQAISTVTFYHDGNLIGSDAVAPYSVSWNGALPGNHVLTAKAVTSGGTVTSGGVGVTVSDGNPAADPDGDGFPTGLEMVLGTNPNSAASQPDASYANLRAWWKLDESSGTVADDSTGRVQDGALLGGAEWTSGLTGNALEFDGVNDGVLVGSPAALTGITDFTVAAWVKIRPGSASATVIQQRDASGAGYLGQYQMNVNANGTVAFFIYNNGVYQFSLTTSAAVNDDQWHHLAGVRAGTAGRIYIDGVEAATGSGAIQPLAALGVSIGYDNRDGNKFFKGLIDDVRIYERALVAAEVDALHDALVPNRAPIFASDPIEMAAATQDLAFSATLAGSASDPDFGDTLVYSKVSGPSWLAVAANGALSGTPSNEDVGFMGFTVRATDSGGLFADAPLSISVTNVNDAPVFTANPITGPGAAEATAYSGALAGSATDIDVGDSLSYSKISGPAWLTIAADGSLTGTPGSGDLGLNSFVVAVEDIGGLTASTTLEIVVTYFNHAPVFSGDPLDGGSVLAGTSYSGDLTPSASDVDGIQGDTLTYAKVSGPGWLSVAANGTLSGNPGIGNFGPNRFVVRVTDAGGLFAETTWDVNVTAPEQVKANNTTSLNAAGSWVGGVVPGSGNVAVWNHTVTSANTLNLGGNLTWLGLRIENPGGDVTLNGGFTLAAGAVDTGSSRNLTIANNSGSTLSSLAGSTVLTVSRAGNNNWTTTLNSADALRFNGTLALRGGNGSASPAAMSGHWLAFGGSSLTQKTGTAFALDTGAAVNNSGDFILGDPWNGKTLHLSALSGFGTIRTDWGNTGVTRTVRVDQSSDTLFNGLFLGHNSRNLVLEKAGSGTLTMAGMIGAQAGTPRIDLSVQAGTLVLAANNARVHAADATHISNGATLQLGNGGDRGTVGTNNSITNQGTLILNRSDSFTLGNLITGSGQLRQTGSGTATLTAANTYLGNTVVAGGQLEVTGSLVSASAVSVEAGGTLTGTGHVAGSVTVAGRLAPGVSGVGTLTTGPLTLASGANLSWNLGGASGPHDLVNAASVNFSGSPTIHLHLTGTNPAGSGQSATLPLVATTGGVSGFANATIVVHPDGLAGEPGVFTVTVEGDALVLTIAPAGAALSPWQIWQATHFGELAHMEAIAGPAADPDGDGVNNRAEMFLGLDPNDPNSRLELRLLAGSVDGGVSLRISPVVPVGNFVIESSDDLGSSWTAGPAVEVSAAAPYMDLQVPSSGSRKFFRLCYTPPESR